MTAKSWFGPPWKVPGRKTLANRPRTSRSGTSNRFDPLRTRCEAAQKPCSCPVNGGTEARSSFHKEWSVVTSLPSSLRISGPNVLLVAVSRRYQTDVCRRRGHSPQPGEGCAGASNPVTRAISDPPEDPGRRPHSIHGWIIPARVAPRGAARIRPVKCPAARHGRALRSASRAQRTIVFESS